jgi:surfeit locus 1 family protein
MRRFRPGVKMTVAVLVLLPLTVALGFWQLHRAAEKRALEEARLASFGTLPMDESRLDGAADYARFRLTGSFDGNRQFLVDNHSRHGVPGYFVVTPFDTVGGRRLLVNRGWIAAPVSRQSLPEVDVASDVVTIEATRWRAEPAPQSADEWSPEWPKRVQHVDLARMGEAVGSGVPIELRLDEGQPGSLAQIVVGEEMTPTRHTAYAVQWFGMALALAVAFTAFGFRRKE